MWCMIIATLDNYWLDPCWFFHVFANGPSLAKNVIPVNLPLGSDIKYDFAIAGWEIPGEGNQKGPLSSKYPNHNIGKVWNAWWHLVISTINDTRIHEFSPERDESKSPDLFTRRCSPEKLRMNGSGNEKVKSFTVWLSGAYRCLNNGLMMHLKTFALKRKFRRWGIFL